MHWSEKKHEFQLNQLMHLKRKDWQVNIAGRMLNPPDAKSKKTNGEEEIKLPITDYCIFFSVLILL